MIENFQKEVKQRSERLRRIAAIEINRHRERHGFLGAALEGSLATGSLWPSSDLDFTVIPHPGDHEGLWVEWGQRDGIPWHKHLTELRTIHNLMKEYPESFIRPAQGHFNADPNWMLDGLATLEIVEDPQGILTETRTFVAERRYAPEVWEGRRAGFLAELRRLLASAKEEMDRGNPLDAMPHLSGGGGFVVVAAQLWLESAQRIYSSKEQDGCLKEVAEQRGVPEAHALYRRICGVEEDRARAAAPLLRRVGEQAVRFYQAARLLTEDVERQEEALLWEAWVRHLSHRMSISPELGHPAHLYLSLQRWTYDIESRPKQWEQQHLKEKETGTLGRMIQDLTRGKEEVERILFDTALGENRMAEVIAAAERLLTLTERRL